MCRGLPSHCLRGSERTAGWFIQTASQARTLACPKTAAFWLQAPASVWAKPLLQCRLTLAASLMLLVVHLCCSMSKGPNNGVCICFQATHLQACLNAVHGTQPHCQINLKEQCTKCSLSFLLCCSHNAGLVELQRTGAPPAPWSLAGVC